MGVLKLGVVFVLASLWVTSFSDPIPPDLSTTDPSCRPIKELLTEWIVTFSISYLADNPANDRPPLNPQDVVPYTPGGLFAAYYGRTASAWEFQSAILDIAYATYDPPSKGERVRLRKQLYTLAKAGSADTARKVMGSILSDVIGEYTGESDEWREYHCVPSEHVNDIWKATSVEFARLRNEAGDLMFGQFLDIGLGTTLAFVIDDTGSMSGEIEAAKQRVKLITSHVQKTLDRPKDFVLVPFNDPQVGPLTVTTKSDEFKKALAKLRAHGGGDTPEKCMGGLKLAIEASRPGSTIYVITDAEAKDFDLQDSVVAEAQRKKISVVFMLTNDLSTCRGSKDRQYKRCFELYQHIANQTSGSVFVVSKGDIFEATEIVQSRIKQGLVVIKQQAVTESRQTLHFPVDRTMTDVEIEAKGICGRLFVYRPRYRSVQLPSQSFGLTWVSFRVHRSHGEWHLFTSAGNKSDCYVKISARSTMGYLVTAFSKKSNADGNIYQLLKGNPSPRDYLRFAIDPYGVEGKQNMKLRFLDELGNDVIEERNNTLVMETNGPLGNIRPFRLVVEGTDPEKGNFRRVVSSLFKPSLVSVTCDFSDVILPPGVPVNVKVTVRTYGISERFFFKTTDVKEFATVTSPLSKVLHPNETSHFNVRLLAPESTADGVASAVTVIARGSTSGSFQYDVCDAVVGLKKRPRIDSLQIKGTVNSRFSETVVTSVVTNNADVGREAEFDVLLPIEAFITNLTMRIDNETIVGNVEEKQKAKKIYDKSKKRGKAAGHVAARESSTRAFKTSMFVEPRKVITFQLVYQQLLARERGKYRYAITLNPEQPVKTIRVDVYIEEEVPFEVVTVSPFKTDQANKLGDEPPPGTDITLRRRDKSVHVSYHPTLDQQTRYSPLGLAGTFEVQYDLQRRDLYGDITHANGYFAHFFVPPTLPVIPKIVVFLIDVSGSMLGYKIEQVREALSTTLRGLNEHDYFNIVFVNHEPRPWINMIVSPADDVSIEDAIMTLQNIQPRGGTDILQGFRLAFELMSPYLPQLEEDPELSASGEYDDEDYLESGEGDDENFDIDLPGESPHYLRVRRMAAVTRGVKDNYEKIMVFLSDGKASYGETDPKQIVAEVEDLNQDRVRINTLGFGPLADMKMLKRIAGFNGGKSRRVFEELDAAEQIRGFFEDTSNLLLTDVSMKYPVNRVEELTKYEFDSFPSGTELVVAGKFRKEAELDEFLDPFSAQIRGKTFESDLELDFDLDPMASSPSITSSQHQISKFTEKLWAFLRVKDLILKSTLELNDTAADLIKAEALDLSLTYNLVTPYTSMIVIKPKERKEIEEELKKEEEETRKKEEKKRKMEEEEAKLDDEELFATSSRDHSLPSSLKKHFLSEAASIERSGPSSGPTGFYGDPHFLVPIRPDLYICFNWDGENGQVYNLLHDDVTGLTVNGRLVTSPAPDDSEKSHRSYISHVAILLPKFQFQILVSPNEITIMPVGASNYTLPVTSSMRFVQDGVTMEAYDVKRRSARIQIAVNGMVFDVIQRKTFGRPFQADHVDFSVNEYDILSSSRLNGVIGQFLNRNAKLKPGNNDNEGFLEINGRAGRVSKFERRYPGTDEKVSCWNSRNSAKDIILGHHDQYVVKDVMSAPSFSFL